MNEPLATLAEAVAILVEPLADLSTARDSLKLARVRPKVFHASIHCLNVASNFCKLVAKLVLLDLDAASIGSRN